VKAILDHVDNTATNIKTFWFRPERPVRYTAGQFTELYLPHSSPDNRGDKRWFTISSSPTDELISITTKYAAEGSSSFKRCLFGLKPGAQVSLADPMGDFVLPKDPAIPLVFVAGGIGVTPIHSMVKYLADREEERDITLIYGANKQRDVSFASLFRRFPLDFVPIIKEPSKSWKGESGVITVERVVEAAQESPNSLVYLSGPEPMIKALVDGLKKAGVNKHRIVTDFFPGYSHL